MRSGSGLAVATLAMTTTAGIWGAMVPLTHALVAVHDPVFVAFARYLIGFLPLWVYVLWRDRGRSRPRRWALRKLIVLGSGMAGFAALYGIGIAYAGPVSSAIVLACGPLIAAMMSRWMLGVPWEPGLLLSIALAFGGGLLVSIGRPTLADAPASHGGEILLVLAMICWNWYSIRAPQWLLPLGYSQGGLSTFTILAGTVLLILAYLVLLPFGITHPIERAPDAVEWIYYAICGFGGVGIAIPLWNFAVARLGLPIAALYLNLAPPVAVTVAALGFGAPVGWLQLLGGAMVLGGVLQIQIRRLRASV